MIHIKSENLPIFKGQLYLCLADSHEEIQEYFKDEVFDEISTANGLATIFNFRGKVSYALCVICFNKYKPNIGVIAHEAIHLAQFVCDHIGYEAKPESDEIYSHLTQYFTDRYINFLKSIGKFELFCK